MRTGIDTTLLAMLAAASLAAESPAPKLKTARVNGVPLAYVDEGRGDAVVLVHGAASDYRVWAGTWPELAKRHRVIAYSRRHHKPNPPAEGAADYSLEAHAADLVALIDHLGLEKVDIVGHSAGANVAALVARRNPGRVRKLVLGEPFLPAILMRNPEGASLMPKFDAIGAAFRKEGVEAAARLLADIVLGPGGYDGLPAEGRQIVLDNLPAQLAAEDATPPERAMDVGAFTCEEAGRITAPTLLLKGERTPRVFAVMLDEVAKCLPKAERAVLPGASHGLQLDNPAGFVEVVQAFLSRPASPPR